MLDDTARKVLRILYNLYRQEWTRIDLYRLLKLSGRARDRVQQAIQQLAEKGLIEQKDGFLRVIEGWERPATLSRRWVD